MGIDDRAKWDERYASGDYVPRSEPSSLVETAVRYVPSGRALVLACGTGRNALYLAATGLDVVAVDISAVAIEMARAEAERRAIDVEWRVADVGEFDLGVGEYDLVTMIRYSNRQVWPALVTSLTDDGWLLLEQHLRTRHEVAGPADEFRLVPRELLEAFSGLRVIQYFEEYRQSDVSDRMTATTGLLACKGDPGF